MEPGAAGHGQNVTGSGIEHHHRPEMCIRDRDCFECGICVYVCPANRPIVQFVRQTKKEIAAAKAAK